MRKFNGNSSQRLAALARSKKKRPEQQALSFTESASGQTARFGQVLLQNPKFSIARIDNVLGDFSEQTGASFG
jgi:hypothetical protein